ncbi:MAG: UDP-N-acetylmuramoylalanine/D-glutamate ligase [Acidimicrobiales bacterium]|nr:UDP-N-acetylmuramoylalanine/D-glutamate ligase [Acidimicrobiales bacterium]
MTVADGAKVLVLGLGSRQGGVGVVRYLHGLGASVRVSDRSDKAALADALATLADLDDVTYHLGGEDLADVNWADVVVRNPGVPAESPMLQHARAHGTPVEMEMTLFLRACPAPVVGVTGTKGKTTTTALLHAMVQRRWPAAVSAGNMGRSALAELDAIAADPTAPVSLELSSFQLESMGEHRMSPHVAVVTNIAPDHLDRYPSFEAYAETKAAIWRYQRPDDWVVLPADDEVVQRLAVGAPGRRVDFAAPSDPQRLTTAGIDLGRRDALRIPGRHAALDAIAAASAALVVGVEPVDIEHAIAGFAGVPHRMELVATVDGVDYVNDTAATTPIAAIAALLAHAGTHVTLITGGFDKQLPLDELADAITEHADEIVLLDGTATPHLLALLHERGREPAGPTATSMADAVALARSRARDGGVVLLSPGCASFGLFRDEFDRGDTFRAAVDALDP